MDILEKIKFWADEQPTVSVCILTGSLAGKGKKDALSDFDIAVFGNDFDFIADDTWLTDIGDQLVCIHEKFEFFNLQIPTRLVIFDDGTKVDFSFHPLSLLDKIISQPKLPDSYNIGYRVFVDKENKTAGIQKATHRGFKIKKPSVQDFNLNSREFWFEIYHVAKYLVRDDLWTAAVRASATKKWLLQMLEWNHGAKTKWRFSPKNDGKGMKSWIGKKRWKELNGCFGKFDQTDGRKALKKSMQLYRKIAMKTAERLKFKYDRTLDRGISKFIDRIF